MTSCRDKDPIYSEPFYTHPCEEVIEDHARHVLLHQYVGCVRIPNAWAVPSDDSVARVELPAVVDILVGCCLWNPQYGYFLVTAFDKQGQAVTLARKDVPSTANPGTVIPSCTKFIFTPNI